MSSKRAGSCNHNCEIASAVKAAIMRKNLAAISTAQLDHCYDCHYRVIYAYDDALQTKYAADIANLKRELESATRDVASLRGQLKAKPAHAGVTAADPTEVDSDNYVPKFCAAIIRCGGPNYKCTNGALSDKHYCSSHRPGPNIAYITVPVGTPAAPANGAAKQNGQQKKTPAERRPATSQPPSPPATPKQPLGQEWPVVGTSLPQSPASRPSSAQKAQPSQPGQKSPLASNGATKTKASSSMKVKVKERGH